MKYNQKKGNLFLRIIIFLSFLGLVFVSCSKERQPKKLAALPEVQNPYRTMWATKNQLFVTDSSDISQRMSTVLVYSLRDFQLIQKFGGPAVFQIQPAHSVFLFLLPDRFAVNSSGKVSIYNYNLQIIKELEHRTNSFFYAPFGEKFIARQVYSENKINYYRLNLYDPELNIIKELCRKEFEGRAFSGDFNFQVYKDKVYVANSRDDFFIEVFDKEGNTVRTISYDCPRAKVTQQHKDIHMSKLTNRPGWENYFDSREKMEEYYRNLIKYPEYFPAITAIHLSEDRIYVVTGIHAAEKRQIWILDLDGQVLEKTTVPFKMRSESVWYPYTIKNRRLYQLIINEETGEWEIYSVTFT